MAQLVVDVTSGGLILAGLFFFLAGTVGLLRFPDVYCRLHALTKADNLGIGFLILGLLVRTPETAARLQLLLIWIVVLPATATICHILASSSLQQGVPPVEGTTQESAPVREGT